MDTQASCSGFLADDSGFLDGVCRIDPNDIIDNVTNGQIKLFKVEVSAVHAFNSLSSFNTLRMVVRAVFRSNCPGYSWFIV
jgi:hypothetical protein